MKTFKHFRTVLNDDTSYAYFDKIDDLYILVFIRADDQGNSYIEIYKTEEEMTDAIFELMDGGGWSVWSYDNFIMERCDDCDRYFRKSEVTSSGVMSYCSTCFEYLNRMGEI